MDVTTFFSILILIFSVVIHEVSHGYAALSMGDTTAKNAGRLTLNPIPHISLLGSIIIPLLFAILPGGILFGWAKPVPYNPYNLRNRRWGEVFVAVAGPLSNLFLALIFGLLIRFSEVLSLPSAFVEISIIIVLINIVLAIFNLMPIPPLDGSKILFGLLPQNAFKIREVLETYGFAILLFFIFFAYNLLLPVLSVLFTLFTGIRF
ncbi:MAG: Zn-dependent protease [Candidatus Paceibacteria bacterium]|jgi:Zn-dependent protease